MGSGRWDGYSSVPEGPFQTQNGNGQRLKFIILLPAQPQGPLRPPSAGRLQLRSWALHLQLWVSPWQGCQRPKEIKATPKTHPWRRAAAQQKPSTRCWPCHCLCSGCSSAASLSLSAPSSATSLAGLFPSRHEPELQQALTNHPPRLRNFITQAGQERERRGKKPSHQQQGTLPGVLQQPHDKTAERCRLPARQPTCSEPSTPGGDQGRGNTAKEAAWRRREGRDRAGSSRQCQRPRQRGHGCPEARCLGGAAVTSLAHAATARCGFGCPAEDSEGLEGLHAHRLAAATTGTGNNGVRRSDGHQNPRRTSQEGETRG